MNSNLKASAYRIARLFALMTALNGAVIAAPPPNTGVVGKQSSDRALSWPAVTRESRPWAYWWWLGSAVDATNITRELTRYRDAGMGGVHIIPIYGAKGWETNYIPYLSPKWMQMLRHAVSEARRLGLDVDMTTGTGWCFGGPRVTDAEANASVVCKTFDVEADGKLTQKFNANVTQALMAFGPDGKRVELMGKITADGSLDWTAQGGPWRVYSVSQKPSGQKVKRPAPGGEGHMLNLAYPKAMTNYLRWFDEALAGYKGPKPRAQYHDSYEYRCDWSPDFFAQFEKRRGYRLQDELPALFGDTTNADRAARVKSDYRETFSDVMAEETLPQWVAWSHTNGFLTRNEAHGSPGNWLDLYAVADIPETEMFYKDRNKLISKFASSAAHTQGKPLVASETGTWLNEHFTETLAEMKYLLDDLFLSGVNHVFYHGTCYSPDEAGWPGWLFYASFEMNPRNSIWRDVPALNAYATRCQSVLQSGKPDNDILLYWPIHDFWHSPTGMVRNLTVHARAWFEEQPIGQSASNLWRRGYAFDYVSDRQLTTAEARKSGLIEMADSRYHLILVPQSKFMPVETLRKLLVLAEAGAQVNFENGLPTDVPGWSDLEKRRAEFKQILGKLKLSDIGEGVQAATIGRGRVLVGGLDAMMRVTPVRREPMADVGLSFIRRAFAGGGGWAYFIANRTDKPFDGWVNVASDMEAGAILDPLTGQLGYASIQKVGSIPQVYLQLPPGGSLILKGFSNAKAAGESGKPVWNYWRPNGQPIEITGQWNVKFIQGGPTLPTDFHIAKLASWTTFSDTNSQAFAGTAKYETTFEAPDSAGKHFEINLGDVRQSARVKVNGKDYGTLIAPPFRVVVDNLRPTGNILEVEVTNVSANRIRDLDRRGVPWKNFHDINFVNLNYRPFDASNWPLTDSGLLGPVTLSPVAEASR